MLVGAIPPMRVYAGLSGMTPTHVDLSISNPTSVHACLSGPALGETSDRHACTPIGCNPSDARACTPVGYGTYTCRLEHRKESTTRRVCVHACRRFYPMLDPTGIRACPSGAIPPTLVHTHLSACAFPMFKTAGASPDRCARMPVGCTPPMLVHACLSGQTQLQEGKVK